MQKLFLTIASLLGGLAVTFGAFGAHYLKRFYSPDELAVFETGVRYQMYHVFALFVSAWAIGYFQHSLFTYSAWAFFLGTVLFSGSLYILTISNIRSVGMITPIGGLVLILGWVLLLLGFWNTTSLSYSN